VLRLKVLDVDVVTDTRTVGGWVVGPEHRERGLFGAPAASHPRGLAQHEGYEVRLRLVTLSKPPGGVGPRRVEVAERDRREPVGLRVVAHRPLHHELRLAVRVDRQLRRVLVDRGL
jgi:hypothetical protein